MQRSRSSKRHWSRRQSWPYWISEDPSSWTLWNLAYQHIKKLFAWPNLKQSVTEFIQHCETCQRAKVEHTKLSGLLQPLPVPSAAWHTISLDFIEGFPKSNGHDVILVVIDKLMKHGHFLPLKHPFTAL
jgi:hypothetical protein